MEISLRIVIKWITIVASCYALVISIRNISYVTTLQSICPNMIIIVFSLVLIIAEVYLFDFFKFFTFLLTLYGKSFSFLLIGALFWNIDSLNLVTSSIFLTLAGVYGILTVFTNGLVSKPLLLNNDAKFVIDVKDMYAPEQKE